MTLSSVSIYVCVANMLEQETIWFIGLLCFVFFCLVRVGVCVGQSAYTLQTKIISSMNYACIYVQINSSTVFPNTIHSVFNGTKIVDFCCEQNVQTQNQKFYASRRFCFA